MSNWSIEYPKGTVEQRHLEEISLNTRRVCFQEVSQLTLVLGSGQQTKLNRSALSAAGCDLVRRRSGGGAVLLVPDEVFWVDLFLPRGDLLWEDDLSRSTFWLGSVWVKVLSMLDLPAELYRGRMTNQRWSSDVCFAGRAPGEVLIGGKKVVGISQRRTRAGARFQCALLLRWLPELLVEFLDLEPSEEALLELFEAAVGVRDLIPDMALDNSLLAEFFWRAISI